VVCGWYVLPQIADCKLLFANLTLRFLNEEIQHLNKTKKDIRAFHI